MSKEIFVKLQSELDALIQQQQTAAKLIKELQAACFDDEDRNLAQDKIQCITETRRQVEETLIRKRDIYDKQIIGLESQLRDRQRILENIDRKDGVFREFPDVLEYFARKQSALTESLASIKKQLEL